MIKAFLFIIAVAVLSAVFTGNLGSVAITWFGWRVSTNVPVALFISWIILKVFFWVFKGLGFAWRKTEKAVEDQ